MTYGIEVGRWTGIFSLVYYADIFLDGYEKPYYSVNALTKSGALKKARKYIDRINHSRNASEIYTYDAISNTLSKIS